MADSGTPNLCAGKGLKPSECQYGDQYALLAAHELIELHAQSGTCPRRSPASLPPVPIILPALHLMCAHVCALDDITHLLRAALILEEAIQHSGSYAQLKLLAMRVYTLLGVAQPALKHWDVCDVKQIQNDSLGYIASDSMALLGALPEAEAVYIRAKRFFANTNVEVRVPYLPVLNTTKQCELG